MVEFNDFHRMNLEKWIRARNPDMDLQSVDLSALWDGSLSMGENFNIIEQKLREYGIESDNLNKRDYKEWEQRAKEWYDDELKKYNEDPEYNPDYHADRLAIQSLVYGTETENIEHCSEMDYLVLGDYGEGFDGPEIVYARIRPKVRTQRWTLRRTEYFAVGRLLGLIEKDIGLVEKILGGV